MVCNSVFDGNIISKGCLTKLENYGNSLGCGVLTRNPWEANSKGWRGLKQKCSPSGGGGGGGRGCGVGGGGGGGGGGLWIFS